MSTKKILTIAAGTLLCAAALFNSSCKKKAKGSFTVKGRLMDSCEGKPYANLSLVVSHRITEVYPKTHDSVGIGKTDANGNFEIVCQNWGDGTLTVYAPYGFYGNEYIKDYNIDNDEGKVYDFGNIYEWQKFFSIINITKSGSFLPSDTLYFGNKVIYPVVAGNSKEIFNYTVLGSGHSAADLSSKTYEFDLYWAFGKAAYDNAIQTKLASNRVKAKYVFCGQPDEVTNITVIK